MNYLEDKDLLIILKDYEVPLEDLQSTDAYNEITLKNRILSFSYEDQKLLLTSAIQLAIVGFGGKNLGSILRKGKSIGLNVLFDEFGVKYKNDINTKLQEDDLTPRRLIRFFRFHILRFIEKTKRPSYLWNKYGDKFDSKTYLYCFPGAEHLINNPNSIEYLIKTYSNLDDLKGTHISIRIIRVFQARGLINFAGKIMSKEIKKLKETPKGDEY